MPSAPPLGHDGEYATQSGSDAHEAWDDSSIASSRPGSPVEYDDGGADGSAVESLPEHGAEPEPGLLNGTPAHRNAVSAASESSDAPPPPLEIAAAVIDDAAATAAAAATTGTSASREDHARQSPIIISSSTSNSSARSPVPSVDPTHARPSLNMTAHEFSEAKTIILDLLGWGVPSEYLMRCGLAREALYYAFTELNLRLPRNFDADGIVPYEPPPDYPAPPR